MLFYLKKFENVMIYGEEHVCFLFGIISFERHTISEPLHMEYYKEQDKRHMYARILDTCMEGNTDRISEISKRSRKSSLERTFRVRFETDVKFDIDVSVTSRSRKPLRGTQFSQDTHRFKSGNKRATMHLVLSIGVR